jgi:hypothetical protein
MANANEAWELIMSILAREYGEPELFGGEDKLVAFLKSQSLLRQLDAIEVAFRAVVVLNDRRQSWDREKQGAKITAGAAVEELNYRLREGGVGYQVENGKIIRVDSQYVHSEIVKRALSLLHDNRFPGAEDEFMRAHGHYRKGENKDAVVDAGAAFESTIKTICEKMKWTYDPKGRASDLVKTVRGHGLFPDYLDKSFDQLAAILTSGLPEVRNNAGSHGQGAAPCEVPPHVAAYALHLCAANIVFLVECMTAKK